MDSDQIEYTYPFSSDDAYNAAYTTLMSLGMRVVSGDRSRGTWRAASSMDMMSWGEDIDVSVIPAGPDASRVNVKSELKFGLVSWGKNKKNINRIHGALNAYLTSLPAGTQIPVAPDIVQGQAGPPPANWYPDPTDPSLQRYWDGAAWTEHTAPK